MNKKNFFKDLERLKNTGNSLLYKQALQHIEKKEQKKAAEILEDLYIKDSKNELYANQLASLYVNLRQNLKAKNIYNKLIQDKKYNLNLCINLSSIYVEEKSFIEAINICKSGLKIDQNSSLLKYNLALAYLLDNQYHKADQTIPIIDNYSNNKINLCILKCIIYVKLKQEEKCFELINSLSKEDFFDTFYSNLISRLIIFSEVDFAVNILNKKPQEQKKRLYLISRIIQFLIKRKNFQLGSEFIEKYGKDNINDAETLVNIGSIFIKMGNFDNAITTTKKALELNSNSYEAHLNLGAIYKDKGILENALHHTQKALSIKNNDDSSALLNLAVIYADMGITSEASKIIEEYIDKYPNNSKAFLNAASIYQVQGDFSKAKDSLKKCIELNETEIRALFLFLILKSSPNSEDIHKLIINKNADSLQSKIDKIDLLFAKSNVFHSNKNFSDAAYYLKKANEIKSALFPSDYEVYNKKTESMMQIDKKIRTNNQKKDFDQINNIFIVGMPRCGSTLLESILCTNPRVVGLGEVFNVNNFYMHKKDNLETDFQKYIKANSNYIYVDKQLYNFLYCGFIINQIPNSKIIHIIRNPLDNLLSIYRTHFSSGNAYSTDISECLKMYLLHLEATSYYKMKYPNNILTVNYEDLVSFPEKSIKGLIKSLNFKWNKSYLEHHKFKRDIQTASKIQARNKINDKSLNSWKNYPSIFNEKIFNSKIYKKIKSNLENYPGKIYS